MLKKTGDFGGATAFEGSVTVIDWVSKGRLGGAGVRLAAAGVFGVAALKVVLTA